MNKVSSTDIKAFTEVKCILEYLPMRYTEKLPKKLLDLINNLYDEKYRININPNIALQNQTFTEDTKNIIAVLKYNYWCRNDEEKEHLAKIFIENEQKYQLSVKEKHNPDNIFKNLEKNKNADLETHENNTNTSLIEYKESFFIRIKNFIFKILHIKKN